jgi:hypothetical protein
MVDIGKRIVELLKEDLIVICVFDTDVSKRIAIENDRLQKLREKYIHNKNVIFCDSLPSIEYWFLLHYINKRPHYTSSDAVEKVLKKYLIDYEKTGTYLENAKWVKDMSLDKGSLSNACSLAEKGSTGEASYSNVYKAIVMLRKTVR